MPNGSPADLSRNVAMMMLGGVPIMVTRPPRIEPNESGIKRSAGDCLTLRAACMATGIKSANAPTLFITIDIAAPRPDSVPICSETRSVARLTWREIMSMTPAFDSARDMISTMATVTVAGWPKPRNASPAGTSPLTTATRSAASAMMS